MNFLSASLAPVCPPPSISSRCLLLAPLLCPPAVLLLSASFSLIQNHRALPSGGALRKFFARDVFCSCCPLPFLPPLFDSHSSARLCFPFIFPPAVILQCVCLCLLPGRTLATALERSPVQFFFYGKRFCAPSCRPLLSRSPSATFNCPPSQCPVAAAAAAMEKNCALAAPTCPPPHRLQTAGGPAKGGPCLVAPQHYLAPAPLHGLARAISY